MDKKRYFSGSKKKFCMNMQGVCDSNCKFISVTCAHVGSTNDAVAFAGSSLKDLCSSQPYPYHWNGDPAYTNTNQLMSPYEGKNLDIWKESFNFFHSQVRITIERTFGIFIQRFGIFWKALQFDVSFIVEIVHCCCRLHNFCIDNNIPILNNAYETPIHVNVNEDGALPDHWHDVLPIEAFTSHSGNALREYIKDDIKNGNFQVVRSHNRT
jgi:hypothetical protein